MTPGERIKAARAASTLTQERLAAKAGLTTRTVGEVERGVRVKPSTLKRIGDALDIPWDDLREETVAS